jgi:hypothetical protein
MYRHRFLSDAQREAIETAHFDLDDREIARYWTLSDQDLLRIDRRRRDSNRCGFAVQLCLPRFPGWPPQRRDRVPLPLLLYFGEQLQIQSRPTTSKSSTVSPTQSELLQEIIELEHSLRPEGHPGHDRSRQSSVRECDPSSVPTWLGAHYLHRVLLLAVACGLYQCATATFFKPLDKKRKTA